MLKVASKSSIALILCAFVIFAIGIGGPVHAENGDNNSKPNPDHYSLSWNQECTAVTIYVSDEGKDIGNIVFYDNFGNGPVKIESTDERPLDSPVDLSTTELQSYISPDVGGVIWIKAGNNGKKDQGLPGEGDIRLDVPLCPAAVVCPYTEDLDSWMQYLVDQGRDRIEVRFHATPNAGLNCASPVDPITVLTVNPFGTDPLNYVNAWIGDALLGQTFRYNSPEEARACAIYLGCVEQ